MNFTYTWEVILRNSDGVKITSHEFDTLAEAETSAEKTVMIFPDVTITIWEVRRGPYCTYASHLCV